MLPILFAISSLIVLAIIVTRPQPVSILSLYGMGTIVYGIPLYFGYTTFVVSYQPLKVYSGDLDPRVYVMYFVLQGLFVLASQFPDPPLTLSKKPDPRWLIACHWALLAYTTLFLVQTGPSIFSLNKLERMQHISVFYHFAVTTTIAMILFQVLYGERKTLVYMTLPAGFILLDLAMGYRSTAFLGGTSALLAYFARQNSVVTKRNRIRILAYMAVFVLTAFFYKPIYYTVSNGTFTFAAIGDYGVKSITSSEPFATVGLLNVTFEQHPRLPDNYLERSVTQYLPFYEQFTAEKRPTYNMIIQGNYFPDTPWGMASTSLGELFAVGGWVAFGLYILVQFAFVRSRPPQGAFWIILFYHFAAHFLIYSYRNDWHVVLNVVRFYLMSAFGVFPAYAVLRIIDALRARRPVIARG